MTNAENAAIPRNPVMLNFRRARPKGNDMTRTPLKKNYAQFNASDADRALIEKIVDRVEKMLPGLDRTDYAMDIEATHCNGCPLRLAELLATDDFQFAHDVFGIRENLDRRTGRLQNLFLPRCSR